jgi:hypothetical protein
MDGYEKPKILQKVKKRKKGLNNEKYYDENKPCELMKYDWLLNKDDFCISRTKCELDRKTVNDDLCFNTSMIYNNTYIYVRVDDNKRSLTLLRDNLRKTSRNCVKEIKLLNNEIDGQTNKNNLELLNKQLNNKKRLCEEHIKEIENKIYSIDNSKPLNKKIEKEKKKELNKEKKEVLNKEKICKEDEVLNKQTNRCVKRTGLIGLKILEEVEKEVLTKEKKEVLKKDKICKEDEVLNKQTNRCVKRTGLIGLKILEELKKKKRKY